MTHLLRLLLCSSLIIFSFMTAAAQVIPKGLDITPPEPIQITEQELKNNFAQAVQEHRNTLRQYWPDAEISSRTRFVMYADDYQKKKAIDFKANELQITMASIRQGKVLNYRSMQQALKNSIKDILRLNLESAIANDPINKKMQQLAGIRYASDLGAMGKDLILSELFPNERPSIKAIERMASKLTKEAYIRYPAVASTQLSFIMQDRTTYIVPLPGNRIQRKARRYKPFIYEYAQQYSLPPSLVFAVIHAESSFNPLARSQIPAFGLMQIVPHTAGKDATKLVYNRIRVLSPSYLYNPRKNVRIGAAYLHLLYYRYLSEIKDPKTRMYCAIAAYNAGLSSVMRTLTGVPSINRATDDINRMESNRVLRTLVRQMPSAETREYLSKVLKLQKNYAQI